jgi:hypothetical protein
MNERIRELAEQCGFVYNENFGLTADVNANADLFAESIIRECALVVHKNIGPKSALNVLEHFGVEE